MSIFEIRWRFVWHHRCYFSPLLFHHPKRRSRCLLSDTDAALAIGTDFDAIATRAWSADIPETLVHVTLDDDLDTGYEPTVGIVTDEPVLLEVPIDQGEP